VSRRGPVIAAIVFFLLAVLAVAFLVFPKMGDVDEAEQRLERAEQEEVALQTELSRLQAAAENADQLRRELARFRRAVPPVADLPGLINELQTSADVAGVDFFSVAPTDPLPVPAGNAAEVPAQIQVVGGFFPVDEFLFRLETLQRASKVTGVSVAEGPDGLPQLQVTLEVRFYTTDVDGSRGGGGGIALGQPGRWNPRGRTDPNPGSVTP
jgi:Tfp pilus assembly protein PilO